MSSQDRRFFDIFTLILGILVVVTIGIYVLADSISERTVSRTVRGELLYQAEVNERIEPIGQVTMPGDEATLAAGAQPVVSPEPVAAALSGPQVYNQACIACHGGGVGGAPMFGNTDAWASRIAQGMEVLYDHSINGFQGNAGYMPPKGGRMDLSDEEVKTAVDYMVAESQ